MYFQIIPVKRILAGIISIFLSLQVVAQKRSEGISLNEILQSLEAKYQVSFAYADENVSGKTIVPPDDALSLDEIIQYLQENTALIFRKLDNRFITVSHSNAASGRLCGFIADLNSREKLAGASIRSGNHLAISDDLGYFDIPSLNEEDENISIQYLGYQNLTVPVHSFPSDLCTTVYLRPENIVLPEISVTNYLIVGIDKKTDGSFDIDSESLGILPGLIEPDVLQTVQSLPGIQSANETVSYINIRGGTHDQNLILWDGIKMYMSGHYFGMISAFNPYLTRNVSLIKNGTSAYYGDGISGTIDMKTDNEFTHFSVGAGINMINADIYAKIPINRKMSLQVSARRSITDAIETPTNQKYYERTFVDTDVKSEKSHADSVLTTNENFNFYDVSLNLRYAVSRRDEVELNFLHINNNLEYMEHAIYDSVSESRKNSLKQLSTGVGLLYNRRWSDKVRSSAFIYVSSYGLSGLNQHILYDQRQIQENEVLDDGIKLETEIISNHHIEFRTGYQFSEIGVGNLENVNHPVYLQYIRKVVHNHTVYGEGFWRSETGRTNFRTGLRLNYLPQFSIFLAEPRFVFNHKITRNLTLELMGEFKSQTTTQEIKYQNDFLGIEKRRWILSDNDDIPVIRSRQISFGGHYQKRSILISVEGYHKKVSGIITSSQGFQNQFQDIRSTGNNIVTGMDILLNWKFRNFSSWMSYSLAHNRYNFPNLDPTEFPSNLDIRHAISSGGSYQVKKFRLSAGVNWHSGLPFTAPVPCEPIAGKEINYMYPNTSRLNDYFRIDLSTIYLIYLGPRDALLEFGVSCWNLLDRRNIIGVYYVKDNQNEVDPVPRYSLGFTPNFMIRFSY